MSCALPPWRRREVPGTEENPREQYSLDPSTAYEAFPIRLDAHRRVRRQNAVLVRLLGGRVQRRVHCKRSASEGQHATSTP